MMARGDDDRSPGATLPHRSFTEPAVGALCSMIGWATDSTADIPVFEPRDNSLKMGTLGVEGIRHAKCGHNVGKLV